MQKEDLPILTKLVIVCLYIIYYFSCVFVPELGKQAGKSNLFFTI